MNPRCLRGDVQPYVVLWVSSRTSTASKGSLHLPSLFPREHVIYPAHPYYVLLQALSPSG